MMDIDYTTGLKVYQQAGTGQRMVSAQADGTQAAVASVVWTGSALVIGTDPGGSEILRIGGGLRLTSTITSTLATGTAPVSVTSTTACPNLNASLLLGSTWAAPAAIGSTTPAAGAFTSAVLGSDPGGSELLRVGGAARVLTTLVAGGEISGDELQVGDNSTYILKLTYGGGAMQAGTYSNRDLQLVTNSTVKAVLGTDGSIVLGTDPGGSDLLRVGGNVKCAALTASAATGAFQAGAQPVGGEDVSAWVSKTSSVAVARGFQSYLTHSGAGGSTAYDAVASTSATSGHNVCYQGVSLATGDATPSFLSFAYGSGDSASSETIANAYGYYWGGWTGAGTITNKWAFFNAATDKSYFGGDVYYNSKFAVGVSTSTALSWSLTINNPTTPLIAMQRADADFAYITNAATVLSGKPTTDLAIMHASTGAVWIGGNGVGMLKVDGTAVTVADASYVYLRGDASTDGSVRISSQSSGTAKLEARSGGTWSNISFT